MLPVGLLLAAVVALLTIFLCCCTRLCIVLSEDRRAAQRGIPRERMLVAVIPTDERDGQSTPPLYDALSWGPPPPPYSEAATPAPEDLASRLRSASPPPLYELQQWDPPPEYF